MSLGQQQKNSDLFLQLTRYLLVDHPFFAQLLVALPKQEQPSLAIPFVHSWTPIGKPVVLYQKSFLKACLADEKKTIELLVHELLHLILGHSACVYKEKNSPLLDIALDLEVWRWLSPLLNKVPDYLQPFFEANIQQEQKIAGMMALLEKNDAAQTINAVYFETHRYWKNNQEVDEHFFNLWRLWWKELSRSLPLSLLDSQLQQRLSLQGTKSKPLSWRLLLRRFAQNATRTYNKNSLRRPSKRYGTIPGVVRKKRQKLLVIVDTSGSVDRVALDRFFNEVHQLYSRGAQVLLLQADYKIQSIKQYDGETPQWVWGRGATAFDPALQYANENGHFDGILYFTDGRAEKPKVECKWPLLWVLVGNVLEEHFAGWQGQFVLISE